MDSVCRAPAAVALLLALLLPTSACRNREPQIEATSPSALTATAPLAPEAPAKLEVARVGQPAPDFTLQDLDGDTFRLSDFKGKTVVLEWFNPGCPYVRLSHTKASLRGAADRAREDGVVWLAINSGAEGLQGAGREANREAKARFGMSYPILLDESGDVGRRYGAKHTPHMFVINEGGVLVYAGAIDNSPDGEGESPSSGKLVRYVDEALEDLAHGRPLRTTETEAYGCAVKYASRQ